MFEASTWTDPHRIPVALYTDPAIYQRELEVFFYGPHWSYVGLEVEIPNPADFKTTFIGERGVIMARDTTGEIHVLENRCQHKGIRLLQAPFGNVGTAKRIVCPYHQWCYKLNGTLLGVPYRAGVQGQGGYPKEFSLKEHGLGRLQVARYNGIVFASFDPKVEPFEAYIGPLIEPSFRRTFHGAELKLLGYNRQRIRGNWKLMQENIKDPYHVGLLHTWFVVFGLIRGDQKSRLVTDVHGRHGAMASTREKVEGGEVTKGLSSFKEGMILHDNRIVDVKPESWWNGPTVVMLTLFPNLIVQQQSNSMSTRQIIPRGPGAFDFVWTHFGFEEDDPDMALRRLRQANMFGPAGYVSADDGEVLEFCQESYEQDPTRSTLAEQGGRDWGEVNHLITENPLRAMFAYWRKVMEI